MKKHVVALVVSVVLVALGSGVSAGAERPPVDDGRDPGGLPLQLVNAELNPEEFASLVVGGFDITGVEPGTGGAVSVEMVVNDVELRRLQRSGIDHEVVQRRASRATAAASLVAPVHSVWRPWSGPGGLEEQMRRIAADNPDITELVTYGQSVNGQDLLAIKVSNGAATGPDGPKPTVMYVSLQHAREWIVGEVNLRLLRHMIDGYGKDPDITGLVDDNELWFVLVANPDGYDHTFTNDRLWRKNLADNDGDGRITGVDGVDLNRNFAHKWGYDNEGSSPDPGSATYRGPSPASEPETRALDTLAARLKPAFFVNYHSAGELLLYGNGWQVATPEPDDNIARALLGDDADPAVAGYDPDPSAELYTTNGETTDHLAANYGTLAYTPELDTCDSAEAMLPDDAFGDDYCEANGLSVFEFPDDETLIQAVFDKNLPLALDVARSARRPDSPVTSSGRTTPDFVVDAFEVSHGSPQTVSVEMKRSFHQRFMHYSINGGPERRVAVTPWNGGERYGDNGNAWYGEYRGVIRGGEPGDRMTVWFSARDGREQLTSDRFAYTLASDSDAEVLVLANEDYRGFNPVQPGATEPRYADLYVDAIEAGGRTADVWDVSAQGVPHPLGVLSHYDQIVWETGDNKLSQEAGDVETDTPFGPLPNLQVAESQQYLVVAVRDYLNEGGKVFQAGEYVGYFGYFGGPLGGAYYGLNGDPTADCVITGDFFSDCLIHSDDFAQYYQGLFARSEAGDFSGVVGVGPPLSGGLSGSYDVDRQQVPESGAFLVTSDVLPAVDHPRFASATAMEYTLAGPPEFGPYGGEWYVASPHTEDGYQRLTQVIDLAGATETTGAQLTFEVSYDLEPGYDHLIVEARAVGGGEWTTLPDLGGATGSDVPADCGDGFLVGVHPALANYLTLGEPCASTGATGEWHAFTGSSGGWLHARFDLSPYSGGSVEVSITHVTDSVTGGIGVFVDDTVVTVGGVATTIDFEADQGLWAVPGAPASSPGNVSDWTRSTALYPVPAAAVSTADTVTFGFGFEAIASAEERTRLMDQILDHLSNPNRRRQPTVEVGW